MNAIEIKNLNKAFIDFRLDNLNLTLPSGCITAALLGVAEITLKQMKGHRK